ncbi:kinetochore Sim4 complex subunit Fta4 [Hypoxylon argillaceum]|nr:kinetochore Sim4 complex subunit Fta4 [Hypoxylon argillaceum]
MAPPTIIAHKSTFLSTQTLHLSQALAPSATWRAANERAEDGLSARAVDDALYRLNHALAQHARRVYAPQASRHVAEQIEGLFYAEAERALRGGGDDADDDDEGEAGGERRLRVGADFTTDEAIASLPPTWSKPREATDHPPEAKRYAELASSLTSLSARRQAVRERVERLRRMAAQLAPFNAASPSSLSLGHDTSGSAGPSAVQASLVTRNGEVERELERMRLLLARVRGRIAQLPDARGEEGDVDVDATDLEAVEREKVGRLLDGF